MVGFEVILFIKFWVRQIVSYCKPMDIDNNYFINNMYDVNNVYLELLENILFVQSKILEGQWTINTIYAYLPSFLESKEVNYEIKLINFYNNIFALIKKEIVDNYKDVYDLRRSYQVNRFHNNYPMDCETLELAYKFVSYFHDPITLGTTEFISKLDKDIFKKKK